MESVGERLRKAREAKGSSIEQAARDTHISQHYIRAIEEEMFDSIPGETYLLGFIRKYSEYLQKDPQEMVTLYKNQLLQEQPLPIHELLNPRPRIWPKLLAGGLGAAVVVALAILILSGVLEIPFSAGGNDLQAVSGVDPAFDESVGEIVAGQEETLVGEGEGEREAHPREDIVDYAQPVGSSAIESRRRTSQMLAESATAGAISVLVQGGEVPSLVRLQADGAEPRQQMLSLGDSLQLDGSQYVQVYASNAGVITLSVNNSDVRLGTDGEVAVARFAWNNQLDDGRVRLEQVPVY